MFKERIKTHHSAMSDSKQYFAGMAAASDVLMEENKSSRPNAVIYIHIPFCNKICSFCDMRRSLQKPTDHYAKLIQKEVEGYAAFPYIQTTVFDAVYFGGGTPTTLSAEELCRIVHTLKRQLNFTKNAEFTVETTVTELTNEKMERLVECGVNRFSVGVQTFDDAGRKKMGRIGSGAVAFEKLKRLKAYSGVIVSMDLIYNYPGQTMESLSADLEKIAELGLDGFSMYSLINMKTAVIEQAQNKKTMKQCFTLSQTP